jgi:ubiquinone/menaquinone biosynthesis C-methylase UbiE
MQRDKWNTIASAYAIIRRNPVSARLLHKEKEQAQQLLKQIDKRQIKTVCDVGCGYGASLDLFSFRGIIMTAVDRNKKFLLKAKSGNSRISFLQATAACLPFRSEIFDLITCFGVMEYIPAIDSLLSEFHRILKRDCHLLVTSTPKNWINYSRFMLGVRLYPRTSESVEEAFASSHFRIIDKAALCSQEQYLLCKTAAGGEN